MWPLWGSVRWNENAVRGLGQLSHVHQGMFWLRNKAHRLGPGWSIHIFLACTCITTNVHSFPKEAPVFGSCVSFGEECMRGNLGSYVEKFEQAWKNVVTHRPTQQAWSCPPPTLGHHLGMNCTGPAPPGSTTHIIIPDSGHLSDRTITLQLKTY